MTATTDTQKEAYEQWHAASSMKRWAFHDSKDPIVRFLRDRKLNRSVDRFLELTGLDPASCSALVLCGGVGGEGTFLANRGFTSVTVSDISDHALEICRKRDARLTTLQLDAESIACPDHSYDLILVQDGLHHMPRPTLGFTEALRIARRGVIILEPHSGLIANLIGTKWEVHGTAENYVFRWNHAFFKQCVYSYLLRGNYMIEFIRLWDHNMLLGRVGKVFGGGGSGLAAIKASYFMLDLLFRWLGNSMIGIVVKQPLEKFQAPIPGSAKHFQMVNPED